MTEDQIKAIAEAYAHIVMDVHKSDPDITGFEWQAEFDACMEAAEDIVGAISTRYCIVEREKVMEEYEEACDEIDFETETKSVLHQNVALGRKVLIESLFGTSMFNQMI